MALVEFKVVLLFIDGVHVGAYSAPPATKTTKKNSILGKSNKVNNTDRGAHTRTQLPRATTVPSAHIHAATLASLAQSTQLAVFERCCVVYL